MGGRRRIHCIQYQFINNSLYVYYNTYLQLKKLIYWLKRGSQHGSPLVFIDFKRVIFFGGYK